MKDICKNCKINVKVGQFIIRISKHQQLHLKELKSQAEGKVKRARPELAEGLISG